MHFKRNFLIIWTYKVDHRTPVQGQVKYYENKDDIKHKSEAWHGVHSYVPTTSEVEELKLILSCVLSRRPAGLQETDTKSKIKPKRKNKTLKINQTKMRILFGSWP